MTSRFPACFFCNHFVGTNAEGKYVCVAFPNGIPAEIVSGDNLHTLPVEGDNGVTYSDDGMHVLTAPGLHGDDHE